MMEPTLVFRLSMLSLVVLVCLIVAALQTARTSRPMSLSMYFSLTTHDAPMHGRDSEGFVNTSDQGTSDAPENAAEAAAAAAGAAHMSRTRSDHDFDASPGTSSNLPSSPPLPPPSSEPLAVPETSTTSDALFTLVNNLKREASEAKTLLERVPSLVGLNVPSVAPSGISSDQPLRQHLVRTSQSGTDWRSLSEHALQERDMYRPLSGGSAPLQDLTHGAMMLDTTKRWVAPVQRPPVCTISKARASQVCHGTDQTSLIGTLLSDSEDTAMGSLVPRFGFNSVG